MHESEYGAHVPCLLLGCILGDPNATMAGPVYQANQVADFQKLTCLRKCVDSVGPRTPSWPVMQSFGLY